jgi:hypothetical protein
LEYCKSGKKPEDIPSYPSQTYKSKGWQGIGDWLGYKSHLDKDFYPYELAKLEVKKLFIKSMNEWREYYKENKPEHLPAAPNIFYKNSGWNGFGDFFSTGVVANYKKKYREFDKAREFSRSLNLNNVTEWRQYCKTGNKPEDISGSPHNTYKDKGWISYGDWLGTGKIAEGKKEWKTFEEARSFAHGLNLKGKEDWMSYAKTSKKPKDIPTTVQKIYEDKWKGWADFLGKNSA